MPISSGITRFLLVPLIVAVIMYVIVHFQLLIVHKLFDIGLTHRKRATINLITFFSVFFAVLILAIINQYLVG